MPLRLNNLLFACFVVSGMVLKQYIRLKASVSKVESNYFNKTNFVQLRSSSKKSSQHVPHCKNGLKNDFEKKSIIVLLLTCSL